MKLGAQFRRCHAYTSGTTLEAQCIQQNTKTKWNSPWCFKSLSKFCLLHQISYSTILKDSYGTDLWFSVTKLQKHQIQFCGLFMEQAERPFAFRPVLPTSLVFYEHTLLLNLLTPNDSWRRRAVSPLKIKIPSKNMREKPTNTPIIHSVY
jgi:hypothetical protein